MSEQQVTSKQKKKVDLTVIKNDLSKEVSLDDKVILYLKELRDKEGVLTLKEVKGFRIFEQYLKFLITILNPTKNVEELEIYCSRNHEGTNFCSCHMQINTVYKWAVGERTYKQFGGQVTLNMDEVMNNCSSVSIHHVSNLTTGYYPGLFDSDEVAANFIKYLVMYAEKGLRYSNVLFTISPESHSALTLYCEKNCDKVYEVENRRNKHKNIYYCKALFEELELKK